VAKEKTTVVYRGLGFFPLLTLIFITLKLTGYINWSWWWVLLPFYGPIAIGLVIAVFFVFMAGLVLVIEAGLD
jgi:hypothetical protein